MSYKLTLLSIVLLAGIPVLLSACSFDDESASKDTKPSRKSKKSRDSSDLEGLLIAPPQLSLAEGTQKYATPEKANMTPQAASTRLTVAATKATDVGDSDAAEVLLNEAIRLDNQNGEAYYQRGRARTNSIAGKDMAAIEDLKKSINLGVGGPRAHSFLARLYDANKQPIKAIEELTIALKLPGCDLRGVHKSRAAIYAAVGQLENALKDYEQLAQIDPLSAQAYFRKGQVLESLKRYDEARAAYEKVVSLDESDARIPVKPMSYVRLALLNSARGKHDEAIANLTGAMKLDDSDDEPLRLRGLEYAKLKNYKKALADFTKAIEISPDTRGNFQSRADVYDQLGRADLASKDRIEAERLNSKPAERPIYELKEPSTEP